MAQDMVKPDAVTERIRAIAPRTNIQLGDVLEVEIAGIGPQQSRRGLTGKPLP